MKKKFYGMLTSIVLAATIMTGCGGKKEDTTAKQDGIEAEDEENYDTGDASMDNPRNQDGIGENELLVVSFGTSFNDNRVQTIGAIEDDIETAFGDTYSVRRGFTSQIIIDHVKSRDGEVIDNVTEALDRAVANNVKNLVVQPTHLMNGYEYNDLVTELNQYVNFFDTIRIGEPLLTSDEDFELVIDAITKDTAAYDDGRTAICFMGHGTGADSNAVYPKLQQMLTDKGYTNYFIGTVEASPTLEDVMAAVEAGGYERVVLQPLMIVAGDHANNDMSGDDEESWKTAFEAKGFEVNCVIKGLGEIEAIRALLVEHAGAAMNAEPLAKTTATASDASLETESVVTEDMVPISGDKIKDGTYDIEVASSSSMFNIEACELIVENGSMKAVMHMGGTGYLYVYMGTGEEAENAADTEYIGFEEQPDGTHTFTVPVEALDSEIECSAFSKKKEKWYDRQLCFKSANIPADAFTDGE